MASQGYRFALLFDHGPDGLARLLGGEPPVLRHSSRLTGGSREFGMRRYPWRMPGECDVSWAWERRGEGFTILGGFGWQVCWRS